jgi:hypothetical protein
MPPYNTPNPPDAQVVRYYEDICQHLDSQHGPGYARANPALVGSLVASAVALTAARLGAR